MTDQSARTTAPPRGMLRLVVLALTLVGFVAMHGLASADGGVAHCGSPPVLLLAADPHDTVGQPTAHLDTSIVVEHGDHAGTPAPTRDSDDMMVGCLLALIGALVAIGLRLLGGPYASAVRPAARRAWAWLCAARGPPEPLFLSLCVFRL